MPDVDGQGIPGAACAPGPRANLNEVAVVSGWFFSEIPEEQAIALSICAECPAQKLCLDTNASERWGIWGGMTAEDRAQYRKEHGIPVRID